MAWFWKIKNNRKIYRYSIGEKLAYYQRQLNSDDPKKRKWARESINRLEKEINKFGNVFIVRDKEFNLNAKYSKPRQVVSIAKKNNQIKVIPVNKNKNMVSLSKFDNQRSLNINKNKLIQINSVYEKRTFKNTENSRLTNQEKKELNKKYNINKKSSSN